MADLLTLAQARSALGWQNGAHANDEAELMALYVPAVTEAIESPLVCGRMVDRRECWRTDNPSPITTPWSAAGATIKSVQINGRTTTGYTFVAPTLTITDSGYTAGDVVTVWASGLPTPATVTMLARRVLSRVWNADKQGASEGRPGGTPAAVVELTAEDLLMAGPYLLRGGFA